MISQASILQRSQEVLHSMVDEEAIMMNINTGEYHNINEIGNMIWELLESPISFEMICQAIMETYEVSQEVCEAEVMRFIQELLDKKLVVLQ